MQVPFTAWSPDIRHHTKHQYKPRPRLPEEHAERRAPSEAGSVRSEGSQRSRRSGGSEASTARGHVAREVVVPQPSRDELGDAHNNPPLDRVTLAARQPDLAWTQQVPPGPDGRQRHLSAVWDVELESPGCRAPSASPSPAPLWSGGGPTCLRGRSWWACLVVQERVDQQRAGGWEARAISEEAANRDLEARLSRANEDRRDYESRLADVTKERDRLATKVKTLERDVATLRKAKPAAQPAEAVERAEGAEAPAPPGDRGRASAAGVRYLLAGAQAWHAEAEACAGQMSALSTGLRMAMMASGQQVDVDSVAPDGLKVTAAMEEVRRQYPPHRLTSAAMDPSFVEAVAEQSSQGTASRSSAPGGGGGCVGTLRSTCPF